MPWNQMLTNLRDILADLYLIPSDARRVVEDAGLNPAFIAFDSRAITNWHNILREADKHNKVPDIVAVAHREYPTNEWLAAAQQNDLFAVKGPDIDTDIDWHGPPAADGGLLEKIIGGRSALQPIHVLELGLRRARSVARVVLASGETGSGFLTHDNLLITNHHVIPSADAARSARVQFNYQQTVDLRDAPVAEFTLAPDEGFATSPTREHDWTAVRVRGHPNEQWGALTLRRVQPQKNDWINIIQHPGGGPKQVALYDNLIVYVDDTRIQYLTDTLPGSSGSPAFNSEWQVIAVHHSGGWLREPQAGPTGQRYYRNEGIHINTVIDGLVNTGLLSESNIT